MVPTRAPTRAASAAQTLWIHFEEALCSGHAWTWCGVVMMLLAVIGPAALVAAICTVGGVVIVRRAQRGRLGKSGRGGVDSTPLLPRRLQRGVSNGPISPRTFPEGRSVFLSARFPSRAELGAVDEIAYVRRALEQRGVVVLPPESHGSLDHISDIFESIVHADLFVFFGTTSYGEDTGNPMCSYKEFTFAQQEKKLMAWIKVRLLLSNVSPLFCETAY